MWNNKQNAILGNFFHFKYNFELQEAKRTENNTEIFPDLQGKKKVEKFTRLREMVGQAC